MDNPLISIVIPTFDRVELLCGRAVPSCLSQTYENVEVRIVGDGSPSIIEQRVRESLPDDPRVHYENIERQSYPDDPVAAWNVRGSQAINYGLDTAQGEWVSTLGDDDELPLDSMETLLNAATERDVDLTWGRSEIVGYGFLGNGNPRHGGQTNHALWMADTTRMDLGCYSQRGLPNDFDLFWRLLQNHRWAYIPAVVYRYHPQGHTPPVDPT
jgi:glycosyltransferase involved in cell wall biosynthesis